MQYAEHEIALEAVELVVAGQRPAQAPEARQRNGGGTRQQRDQPDGLAALLRE